MKTKHIKSNSLELKDFSDKEGIVSFYFADFDSKDSDNDIIRAGAYKKTIEENKARIKHFKNHDATQVVGVLKEIGEDHKGAYAVSQIAKTTLGRDTLIEYEAGIITEHSHGFQIMQDEFDQTEGANIIKEVRLWEVSSLTHWGANQNTPVIGIKSAKDAVVQMQKLNHILHNSKISDEKGEELLKQYDELNKFFKSLNIEPKPIEKSLGEIVEPTEDEFQEFAKHLNL